MPKKDIVVPTENQGMIQVYSYFILFVVNALVIYFANLWFPMNVVLGTMSISQPWAIILTAGALALIGTLLIPFFNEWEMRRRKILSAGEWMLGYLFINFVGLWLLTRASEIFGMGVTSWVVLLILAIIMDILQGIGMMSLESKRQK